MGLTGFFTAFVLGAGLTGLVRTYALRSNILDVPNERSSHAVATPRGGGFSIVVICLGAMLIGYSRDKISFELLVSVMAGGVMIAGIGFADDHKHVAASWRFGVHVLAATFVLIMLGGLPAIPFGDHSVDLGIAGDIVAAAFMVWFINAFNFMDGIDGLAATEAIFVAGAALALTWSSDNGPTELMLGVLVAASLGFLVWNWPPAKIFMGDVASGFIGFLLVFIALLSSVLEILPVWSWLILAAVFVVDATVTLLTRAYKGERWYSAHKSHAYQHAARRFNSHGRVTVAVAVINAFWLFPLAWLASREPAYGWWLLVVAWAPLIAIAMRFRAGMAPS